MGREKKWAGFMIVGVLLLAGAGCGGNGEVERSSSEFSSEDLSSDETAEGGREAAALPLTPPQGEGPYYPVEKPADRDDDLTIVAGRERQAEGQILLLNGRVLLQNGTPVSGARVEIWQTDGNGIYLHPNDPNIENRDPNFQSYGESVTDASGRYAFTTLYPQLYGSRPRHIHAKIRMGEEVVLTTQFYFAGDERLQSDGLVAQAGGELERLLVDLRETTGPDGERMLTGQLDVVLPVGDE